MSNRPAPDIDLDESLVSALLQQQHPDLAELPISILDRGWDNTNFRLGEELIVRLPHRHEAVELIENEQRWLPELAPRLPLPISSPERVGRPGMGYPWPWSIGSWVPGEVAATAALGDEPGSAVELGRFLAALHRDAPATAPINPHRGVSLATKADAFTENLANVESQGRTVNWDLAAARSAFDQALRAPETNERAWLHGDLHTKNIIVSNGRVAAVIDWGDICCGDRATDLVAAWMLVPSAVETVMSSAGADESAWERARGWAVHFAVLYEIHSDDDPVMKSVGTKLMNAVLDR